jgi:hypothetical protein
MRLILDSNDNIISEFPEQQIIIERRWLKSRAYLTPISIQIIQWRTMVLTTAIVFYVCYLLMVDRYSVSAESQDQYSNNVEQECETSNIEKFVYH